MILIVSAQKSSIDPIDEALALYDGDDRAVIGALLETLQFVRGQFALTEAGMSVGERSVRMNQRDIGGLMVTLWFSVIYSPIGCLER